jgi:hypothetical protein
LRRFGGLDFDLHFLGFKEKTPLALPALFKQATIFKMSNSRRDFFYLAIILVFFFAFWAYALHSNQIFFMRDLAVEHIAKRAFWVAAHDFSLWHPLCFFGAPDAANPQTGALYPLNIIFLLLGAERGLTFFTLFHHLLFLLTFYAATRRMGFDPESSLIMTVGLGFGGQMISITLMITMLSVFVWLPLIIILLDLAVKKNFLYWTLLLGLTLAVQLTGGEVQIAAISWGLALCALLLAPKSGMDWRAVVALLGAFLLGLAIALVLFLPQLSLTMEMIPFSNRAGGYSFEEAILYSISLKGLQSLLLPNYILPISLTRPNIFWKIGFFNGFPYLLSHYLGLSLFVLALASFVNSRNIKAWLWLGVGLAGITFSMAKVFPFYELLFRFVPGFSLFRVPEKFMLLCPFSVAMLAGFGCQEFKKAKWSNNKFALTAFLAGALIAALLIVFPVRMDDWGNNYGYIQQYLLARTLFILASLLSFALGLILLKREGRQNLIGAGLALVIFVDLFIAHHNLNPTIDRSFLSPKYPVKQFAELAKKQHHPVRIFSLRISPNNLMMRSSMDPIKMYKDGWDAFQNFSSSYYGLNDVRARSSLYLDEIDGFCLLQNKLKAANWKLILARAGVEFLYHVDHGYQALALSLPRAMVYYQAVAVKDRDQALSIWSDPNFPALRTILLETEKVPASQQASSFMSEPAQIQSYQNEKVVIEANAKRDGWLLLLDTFYPGWKATVDGRPVEICRANRYFRAVQLPAGKHTIIFSYRPASFYRPLYVSCAGFVAWVLTFTFLSVKKRKPQE